MTHASLASLLHEPSLARDWVPKILVRGYATRAAHRSPPRLPSRWAWA